jgi:RNA polymerase sigma-70 factor (ECF subfamily)
MTPEHEAELGRLMARVQKGDALAYERLLGELRTLANAYMRRRAGPAPWVEDATQDVLLSVHRGRHTWQPTRPFLPWFYAIVASRWVDGLRRQRRVRTHEVAGEASALPADGATGTRELTWLAGRDIRALLRTLAVQQRRVLVRIKLHGQTAAEVGAVMGLTEGHVRVVAHRAMRALQLSARSGRAVD